MTEGREWSSRVLAQDGQNYDLDKDITSKILKFADDTKLLRPVRDPKDCLQLQNDLDSVQEWATKWEMTFNVDKCKVLHFGRNNPSNGWQSVERRREQK